MIPAITDARIALKEIWPTVEAYSLASDSNKHSILLLDSQDHGKSNSAVANHSGSRNWSRSRGN
jgi:hypothetical protein